jgi:type IV pilus assembly protein PilQ
MAYDQKDKGAIQDIETFNVERSAENFRDESGQFKKTTSKILDKNSKGATGPRRISLEKGNVEINTRLSIIDHNFPIKNLENDLVTFKFNDIDLKSALKLFASTVKRNIIIGNEVQGNLTMDFEDIKWGSAVYAVLDMNNLVMKEDKQSGLLRVHSSQQFKVLAESKISQTKAINDSLAMLDTDTNNLTSEDEDNNVSEIFKIFYQTSADVIPPLQAAVGENATITDDKNNNQLIVTASLQELDKVDLALEELDIEKKQVMIEAYIINATDNFTKNFNANLIALNQNKKTTESNKISFTGISTNPGSSTAISVPVKDSIDLLTDAAAAENS